MKRFEEFTTRFVQSVGKKEGSVSPVITPSASYGYGDPQTAEGIFEGSVKKPVYARMGNPTTGQLETILAQMDGGIGAVATGSGMGAVSLAVLSLAAAGDELISIGGLFGGTYSFFSETLPRFGITTRFFGTDELDGVAAAITPKTKAIFLESVGNPSMRLPDIVKAAAIADEHGVALIVDNTITPLAVSPLKLGADMAVYSTTKIISGNAAALGGAAVFRGIEADDKFRGERYKPVHKVIEKMGAMALIPNAKKKVLRDFGMSANAFASYLTLLGLETLPLRMDRIADSVEQVAAACAKAGLDVNHPSLSKHPDHALYQTAFQGGCGTLMTIDLGSREKAFSFLEKSRLATITANIGDSRTLALHMASTIYRDFDEEAKAFLGITPGLVRISIGLENPQDIIEDFIEAAR